jgi:hypothetical protein
MKNKSLNIYDLTVIQIKVHEEKEINIRQSDMQFETL